MQAQPCSTVASCTYRCSFSGCLMSVAVLARLLRSCWPIGTIEKHPPPPPPLPPAPAPTHTLLTCFECISANTHSHLHSHPPRLMVMLCRAVQVVLAVLLRLQSSMVRHTPCCHQAVSFQASTHQSKAAPPPPARCGFGSALLISI